MLKFLWLTEKKERNSKQHSSNDVSQIIMEYGLHYDRNIYSSILALRVSFWNEQK